MRAGLPSGTVTFLFTDVEGSTRLLQELGSEAYAAALAEHRRLIRGACDGHGGVEVDTQGDAFFFAFPTAPGALAAAAELTEALDPGSIRVRVGLHTGTPLLSEEGYVGADVHRAARIAAAGHGGQVLVSAATATLLDGAVLRDLGEYRFKDLAAAERVFQLGETEFPPLKTLYRTNLPVPATPFLGREHELAEVVELLRRDEVRLVTLTGPGGTGKTRLALQAAAEVAEGFPAGIWWVPLAPLRDPGLIETTIEQALNVTGVLAEHLRGKRLLILLDNAEHLLPRIAETVAALRDVAGPSLLVTSRERLQLDGEHIWAVPQLTEVDGVELFSARARALKPAFVSTPAVPVLCDRLDNLPLALELAAARTVVFSPEQLLDRLGQRLDLLKGGRDADPRQQTLRATIEWSYDLLEGDEQRLFVRFGVFAGGCTYEAAEHVCEADPDTLQSLLDKSLLRRRDDPAGPRFWQLETIREFALDRLADSDGAAALELTHAAYYVALAEDAALQGAYIADLGGVEKLLPEQNNVRSALESARRRGEIGLLARAVMALWGFWLATGYAHEGIGWARLALERHDELSPDQHVGLLVGASELFRFVGDLDAAEELKHELVRIARSPGGNRKWLPGVLADLADIELDRGDIERARAYAEESLNEGGGARAVVSLGEVELYEGNYAAAQRHFEEAADGFEGVHDFNHAATMEAMGEAARRLGDTDGAVRQFSAAARFFATLGDQAAFADCLEGLAALAAADGDVQRAGILVGAAGHLRDEWRRPPFRAERVPDGLPEAALAHGRSLSFEEAVEFALESPDSTSVPSDA